MKLFEVDSRFIFETSSLIHPSKHTYGMAIIYSIEKINERLNQLRIEEENNETERSQLLDHLKKFSSNEDTLKVVAALTSLHKNMELIKEERLEILKHFPRHMEEDRALRFITACSPISYENVLKAKFPSDHQASCFAKHLYATTNEDFPNMETNIDDATIILFNALGFNDSDLITMSRKRLNLKMSNKMVHADVDLCVVNLKAMIRLVVVQDKIFDDYSDKYADCESQLVAEAVAAAMYNEKIIAKNRRRTVSAPAATGVNLSEIPSADTSVVSNIRFYAHKFSNMILNCIANEIEPNETTQIEKFSVMENGVKRHGLSLIDADDRAIIFRIMDCIQQTISTV
ncbi:unnamed protein product [Rotaria socialis]|uniref:Uncharacterized protein n=1 Tax=Rotaria socialis TaxID=392032 RepID=A0A818G1D5_9BILA|nr:unnamed protein product [Rotaria socialis]CAF4773624.1 unnamed protein product [Rotaria socialis]